MTRAQETEPPSNLKMNNNKKTKPNKGGSNIILIDFSDYRNKL